MEFNANLTRALTAVALTLAAASAPAQEPRFVVDSKPGQQTRGARLATPEMRLSLKDAVAIALEHNINIEVSRLSLASAGAGIIGATGVFDPYTRLEFTESSSTSPATNQLVGAQVSQSKRRVFNATFGQTLPTGGSYQIGWDNTRSETNSTFYFLNPSYNSSLGLQVSQPLLQGFGTDVNRAAIDVASRNRDVSALQFEQIVIGTVQSVEAAYWDLVYAIDNLKVKEQSLKLAQDLLDQTRTRVRIGTSAPIDIIQSEATVAAREQDIIVAGNIVQGAADTLKQLLGFEDLEDWKSTITPTDSLSVSTASVDYDQAIEQALTSRLELKQLALQREISEIRLSVAKNAVLPSLNLVLGYGYSGVGGTYTYTDPNTGVVTRVPGGWDDSLRQIRDGDYEQWSAGLNFTYTLGNHDAKAKRAQQEFGLMIARQNLAAERQQVINETRSAVRGLADSAKSIMASEKARELAERNLDAEQKKFANGMSTNYQVLKIQEDLAIAQAAELASRVAYRKAMVAYQVAIGNLLANKGVKLHEEPLPKPPHTFLSKTEWLKYAHWSRAEEKDAPPAAKE